MNSKLPYDPKWPKSIESYAMRLLGKSLKQVLGENIQQVYSGKGKLGQLLEDLYFQYKPNSNAEPDFKEAGVELKTTPIKISANKLVSKERLVFNIINYNEEYKETFETSSFWKKNNLLLLFFFMYEEEKLDLDYIFKIVKLWQFPATDLKIIKDDWEKIIAKIRQGKAHEISEGDTFYLGACTKGANNKSLRTQPFSDEMAMQRAFSLKSKYLNFIIEESLANEKGLDEQMVLEEPLVEYATLHKANSESVIKSIAEYSKDETFEQIIIKRFQPFYDLSEHEIIERLNLKITTAKSKFYLISKEILGISKGKIQEFEKADILMKTIRLENSGSLKESMSFAQIQFTEIIQEEWDDSYWFSTLSKRFFFVVFQKDSHDELRLKKVMFWTMPVEDLRIAEMFWEDTKEKIIEDDYNNFIKISDDMICHVRPKGADSRDLMETPSSRLEKKKCFWLNASYIRKIVE